MLCNKLHIIFIVFVFILPIDEYCQTKNNSTIDPIAYSKIEMPSGLRVENNYITKLILNKDAKSFTLYNEPRQTNLVVFSCPLTLDPQPEDWYHSAFVYSSSQNQFRHYVEGVLQPLPEKCELKSFRFGDEAYFTIYRNGLWEHPLSGRTDELNFSSKLVYLNGFSAPDSISHAYGSPCPYAKLIAGPKLLFISIK